MDIKVRKVIACLFIVAGICLLLFSVIVYRNNKQPFILPVVQKSETLKIQDQEPAKINLTHGQLFTYRTPLPHSLSTEDPSDLVLLATGDVIPARSVNFITTQKNDFTYPFLNVASFLQKADLVFINLESPLIDKCPLTSEGMIFCGDSRFVKGLKFAGVDVASLANNHMGNHGLPGIQNTVRLLEENGIKTTGTGSAAIVKVKNKTLGFLGFNDIDRPEKGIARADISEVRKQIGELRSKVDILIVTFHWGVEYVEDPNTRQKELAHISIDSGADLVIGNHPHWVQGVEIYKNKFITYAHGNLVFDQMWSRQTREGVIGAYVFGDGGLKSVQFYPVIIENYSQPRFASEKEAVKILDRMKLSSEKIRKDI